MAALANNARQYVGSVEWGNVAAWISNHSYAAGVIITNTANTPALGNERCFVSIVAGTSTNGSLPALTATKGAKTVDNGVTWQECTGQPGVNGDITNSPVWGASLTVVLGQIIYDSISGALQICSTAGTTKSGSPPSFSGTAGTTTSDNTVTWTSLGAASNFGAWAAPHKRILNADAATWQTVTPAVIFISSAHAETQSSALTLTGGQGTAAKQNQYLSVSSATAPPTSCTSGASVSTTGASNLGIATSGYYNGISFNAGSSSNAANLTAGGSGATTAAQVFFENCTFTLANTSSSSAFIISGATTFQYYLADFLGCSWVFGATTQKITLNCCNAIIRNGTIAGSGSVPAAIFSIGTAVGSFFTVRDTDLSNITGTLFANNSASSTGLITLENCKLGSGVTMTSGSLPGPGGALFRLHDCDSGSKNYRFYEGSYLATIQQETTTINNAGASDGTTGISWNIATSANTHFGQPYVSPEITARNDTTGSSLTATIEIAGANTLTNGDIWMEIEYLGNSSFPIGSVANNRVTDALTATSNVTSSSASWGGSPAVTQKLQVAFTPQMKGPVKARVYVAKPSTTVFMDPLLTIA